VGEWTRSMLWAQGSLIRGKDMVALGLAEVEPCWGVVISHDCDLANVNLDAEPAVELIVAQSVYSPDGNCQHAKNARKLHLDWEGGSDALCLELLATCKRQVDKTVLVAFQPVLDITLPPAGKRILQSWLAARYRRQALPDSLGARLVHVVKHLEKRSKREAASVLGYWISFSPVTELPPDDPYDLNISIVYTVDKPEAADAACTIADDMTEYFGVLVKKAGAGGVMLGECQAYSEEEFTLHDIRHYIELRLDYLSNRAYPDGVELD